MNKAVKVLEALMYGNIDVKMDGMDLVYSREHEGVFFKGEKFEHGQPIEQGKGTPVLLNADFDLNYFIRKCEEMPDHEILGICGSLALTKQVHAKRKPREGVQLGSEYDWWNNKEDDIYNGMVDKDEEDSNN